MYVGVAAHHLLDEVELGRAVPPAHRAAVVDDRRLPRLAVVHVHQQPLGARARSKRREEDVVRVAVPLLVRAGEEVGARVVRAGARLLRHLRHELELDLILRDAVLGGDRDQRRLELRLVERLGEAHLRRVVVRLLVLARRAHHRPVRRRLRRRVRAVLEHLRRRAHDEPQVERAQERHDRHERVEQAEEEREERDAERKHHVREQRRAAARNGGRARGAARSATQGAAQVPIGQQWRGLGGVLLLLGLQRGPHRGASGAATRRATLASNQVAPSARDPAAAHIARPQARCSSAVPPPRIEGGSGRAIRAAAPI